MYEDVVATGHLTPESIPSGFLDVLEFPIVAVYQCLIVISTLLLIGKNSRGLLNGMATSQV